MIYNSGQGHGCRVRFSKKKKNTVIRKLVACVVLGNALKAQPIDKIITERLLYSTADMPIRRL